ncbi:MAG: rod shape-determining protein RodA [bacterium]
MNWSARTMRRIDPILLCTILLLIFAGCLSIYSAAGTKYLLRQLIFLLAGTIALIAAIFCPRRYLYGLTELLYALSLFLLIAVLNIGTGPGTRRWFAIGSFTFQPSEFAKITTILMLAKYLSYKREMKFDFRNLAGPLLVVLAPVILTLAEPDLSTALVFLPAFAAMLYWQGLKPLHILLLFMPLFSFAAGFSLYLWIPFFLVFAVIVFVRMRVLRAIAAIGVSSVFGLLSPFVLSMLKEYQRQRIMSYFAPWFDPHGLGWNAIQSQIAIGSGRILGKGYLHGSQKRLGFIPNRHTDFIFSCIAEEFGLIGSLLVLIMFGILFYRILVIAYNSRDQNGALLCIGFTTVICYQTLVNIGMLLGLLPITGITLPFISYGGSSLVASMVMIGLILNVATRPE